MTDQRPQGPAFPRPEQPFIDAPPAPPGAYAVPVGGYQAPVGAYAPRPIAPPPSRTMGALALGAALLAAVLAPIIAAALGFQIGAAIPLGAIGAQADPLEDLALLSPVRTQVLWAEITGWSATALGVIALVLGIIATVKRRGRGMGITAIVLAAIGPGLFFLAVSFFFGIGAAVGSAGAL